MVVFSIGLAACGALYVKVLHIANLRSKASLQDEVIAMISYTDNRPTTAPIPGRRSSMDKESTLERASGGYGRMQQRAAYPLTSRHLVHP